MISGGDLKQVVDRLTGDQKLNDPDMEQLINNVRFRRVAYYPPAVVIQPSLFVVYLINIVSFQIFAEADLDDDNMLSFAEFEHVISKAPDFVK